MGDTSVEYVQGPKRTTTSRRLRGVLGGSSHLASGEKNQKVCKLPKWGYPRYKWGYRFLLGYSLIVSSRNGKTTGK